MEKKFRLFLLLALLLTAATGAWAQTQWESGSCTVTLSSGTLTVSGNGAMADYTDPSNRPWHDNKGAITSVVVESGVTSVGQYAFESFSNLTSVTLPEGLTAIGSNAFTNCSAMTSVTIPSTVTAIGTNAFSTCSSLQSITIPSTVTSIAEGAFYRCSSLTSVTIPSTVTSIGGGAFGSCSAITSITLPEGLTAIGYMTFGDCGSLTSITIPSTVTSIGEAAFFFCPAISEVNLYANPDNLTWGNASMDFMSGKATQCHVLAEHLSTYQTKFSSVNVTFVGDLKPLTPTTYSVTLAEGTEDADKWTVKVGEGEAQTFPVEGLEGGEKITVTYGGERKVKSVKAVKKAAVDPAKAYLTWDKDQKKLVATEIPAEVTTVENADGVTWTAGTYVVDGQVTINGAITLSGEVDLIIKDGAKLTANKINGYNNNLRIYGQANQTGQLVVDNSGDDAITSIKTLEVHSAKVTATSSKKDRGGFYYTRTINVYGGSVDATAANGYGIWLTVDGSMNIYGGEVKAVGKGTGGDSYGIKAGGSATVTVNGGKLWAENADKQALQSYITITKGEGFTGKIEYSSDNSTWSETADANAKYVRVGY